MAHTTDPSTGRSATLDFWEIIDRTGKPVAHVPGVDYPTAVANARLDYAVQLTAKRDGGFSLRRMRASELDVLDI